MTTHHAGGSNASELLQELGAAVRGLVYSSESDRPFDVFLLAGAAAAGPLTPQGFAEIIGADSDEVGEETLDRFLSRHIEMVDPLDAAAWERLPRYDALKRLLRERLHDVRVFRIGSVQVRCFAVGRDAAGNLAGIETVAIET
ncbi:hypothetical protein BH23GEM3_BH23GEM3_00380 [soil metagenome]